MVRHLAIILAAALLLAAGFWFAFGRAGLGGGMAPDFTLTDQDGHPWTLSHLRGRRAAALFFGFAHCTDVCPATLAALERARRSLGARGGDVAIVFVTVDAARDTPAALGRYVRAFDPGLVGLTGDARSLDPVYAAYGVWQSAQPHAAGAAYDVAHSTAIDFVDRSGRLAAIAPGPGPVPEVAAEFRRLLR
jgi:protein SCO1/2